MTIDYGNDMSRFNYYMTYGFIEENNTVDLVPIKIVIDKEHPSGSVDYVQELYFNISANLSANEVQNFISFNRCMVSSYKVSHRLLDATKEAKQDLKEARYTHQFAEIIDVDDNKLRPSFRYCFNMVGLKKEL